MIENYEISMTMENGKKSWFCPYCNKSHKSKRTVKRHLPLFIIHEEVKAASENYLNECEKELREHKQIHMAENWDNSKNDEWQEVYWKLAKKVRDARESHAETIN